MEFEIVHELKIHNKKAQNIKEIIKNTKEKRKKQICKTYEVKIDKSHLNNNTLVQLNMLFLEAKWFYNYILSQEDIFAVDYKIKNVPVKVIDHFEDRQLIYLSSQMKQGLLDRTIDNIVGLARKKEQGKKVGRLQFKSVVNSIPLKQFDNTYKIDGEYVKIQKIKQRLRVRGVWQIQECDIANATLIRKHNDYYLRITTYQDKKEENNDTWFKSTGLDFGIARQVTMSNGIAIQYRIPITNKLRRLYKQFSRKIKHSKNWYKVLNKIQKEFDKLNNIKKDIKNKIIHFLKENYGIVCYQDESVKAWQHLYGNRIFQTSIGGIISMLHKIHTPVEVPKFYPSTKTCSVCGNIQDMTLADRIYDCNNEACDNVMDRDYNSANTIEQEGLRIAKQVGTVHTDFMPIRDKTSTIHLYLEYLNKIPYCTASLVNEIGSPVAFSTG